MYKQLSVCASLVWLGCRVAPVPSVSKAQEPPAATEPEDAVKQVKPTTVSIAHAKKLFGFDCAMCHGKADDGQGDLADRDETEAKGLARSELPEGHDRRRTLLIVSNGKGQMPEGKDQMKLEEIWNMVLYVRSFRVKDIA